ILFYDPASGAPLLDEYHQHASWFPFHLKENPDTYPYMYVSETLVTLFGINCLFTWDHIYTVTVAQFIMHFEYVNTELARLNAKDTMEGWRKSKDFYKDLVEIIKYHQHILRLGDKLRSTFNLPLFLTDLISGASICFHIYLIANTDDIIAITLFIFPCFVQVAFAFDNCYQGSRIESVTTNMSQVLFEQNWYDATIEYRKFLIHFLLFASRPFTLSGYNLFSIDMVHFRVTMMIAYRMFTFLQARGSKIK
ncbi:odorant receptor 88a-like, partial [Musca vetustissima]|uniref:odorant receptor 88a-like n=1 Tax=Musca vetustissima TaxID=27455 RepID=UPI002AB69CC6